MAQHVIPMKHSSSNSEANLQEIVTDVDHGDMTVSSSKPPSSLFREESLHKFATHGWSFHLHAIHGDSMMCIYTFEQFMTNDNYDY